MFTIQSPIEADKQVLLDMSPSFLHAGLETAPTTGSKHAQGYMEFRTPRTLLNMIKRGAEFDGRIHYEVAKSPHFALLYTKKGTQPKEEWEEEKDAGETFGIGYECWFQFGARKNQGARNDLKPLTKMIAEGATIQEVAEEFPEQFIKFGRGIQQMFQVKDKPRSMHDPLEVIVCYGNTGCGKTWSAMADHPGIFKLSISMGEWFCGYNGQLVVLIDEYRAQFKFGMLLQLLDRYPLQVQVKGGHVQWKPAKIIITSPMHPALWYDSEHFKKAKIDGALEQLRRRITSIHHFTTKPHRWPTDESGNKKPPYTDMTDVPWEDIMPDGELRELYLDQKRRIAEDEAEAEQFDRENAEMEAEMEAGQANTEQTNNDGAGTSFDMPPDVQMTFYTMAEQFAADMETENEIFAPPVERQPGFGA